jgi:hypothetical protein
MEALNLSLEDLNATTMISPASSTSGFSPVGGAAVGGDSRSWAKTISWHGQPAELRSKNEPLAPYTTYTANATAEATADAPLFARQHQQGGGS